MMHRVHRVVPAARRSTWGGRKHVDNALPCGELPSAAFSTANPVGGLCYPALTFCTAAVKTSSKVAASVDPLSKDM